MILDYALTFAIGCFALALALNLWRLATADNFVDRVLAVDTMAVNITALISTVRTRRPSTASRQRSSSP